LRLREYPDFEVLLAEELEKVSGGGECKERVHRTSGVWSSAACISRMPTSPGIVPCVVGVHGRWGILLIPPPNNW
jgi:hypothetical protein